MLSDRRWRIAAAVAAVVAVAAALSFVVLADDSNEPASLDTVSTTKTSHPPGEALATSTPSTTEVPPAPTAPPTSTAPPVARVPVTTTFTTMIATNPERCPRPAAGSDFDGFGAAEIVIENAEGSRRSCVLTADTPNQQAQGLMRQDDLDGYEGMIFRFPTAEEQWFWMRNTSIPLSIAFFDAGGAIVSALDMEPCGDSPDCPKYMSGGAAKFALEVIRGRLPVVGATPGSRLIA